jgi:DNA-binding XRE family transcriptional regulator
MQEPGANLRRHRCNAIDCPQTIPAMRFMCDKHWNKIDDESDKKRIMHGLRIIANGGEPPQTYLRAASNAVMGVGNLEARVGKYEFAEYSTQEVVLVLKEQKKQHTFSQRPADVGKSRVPPKVLTIDARTGANLRAARVKSSLGLSTIAHGVGVSAQALEQIEKGEAAPISLYLAERLCQYLKIDLNDLIERSKRTVKTKGAR